MKLNQSSKRSTMYRIIIAAICISSSIVESTTCSRENCRFGGTCQLKYVYGRRPGAKSVCKCPSVKCYQSLYEPVCGTDGVTYFNVLCMIMQECEDQKPIKPVCFGPCGTQLCKETEHTKSPHRSCTEHERTYCRNGGLCYHHVLLRKTICKCTDNFSGEKCDKRILGSIDESEPTTEACLPYKICLALMTGLLLAIVLYHLILCAFKIKNREIKKKCSLWKCPSEKSQCLTEDEERTPLRCTRDDNIFRSPVSRPRVNGISD